MPTGTVALGKSCWNPCLPLSLPPELQEKAAQLLGVEQTLFVPTNTMANLICGECAHPAERLPGGGGPGGGAGCSVVVPPPLSASPCPGLPDSRGGTPWPLD